MTVELVVVVAVALVDRFSELKYFSEGKTQILLVLFSDPWRKLVPEERLRERDLFLFVGVKDCENGTHTPPIFKTIVSAIDESETDAGKMSG